MGEQQKIRPFPPRNGGTKVHVEPFRVVRRHTQEHHTKAPQRVLQGSAWDNRDRYQAQSILADTRLELRDGHYIPTLDEARDILAWAGRGAHV